MTRRLTLRARLTVLFTAAFLVAGLVLVGLSYAILNVQLNAEPSVTLAIEAPPPDLQAGAAAPTVKPLDETAIERIKEVEAESRRKTLAAFLGQSLAALLAVGAVAAGLGFLLARRALRPLTRITETARRVAGRNLHERIGLDGPEDEVTELAETFDGMLDRLDRSFAGQRAFVGNASHELKTPLAVQRTLIEVAMADPAAPVELRDLGRELLQANARSESLIQGLLLLAQTESQVQETQAVDLTDMVERVLAVRERDLELRGISGLRDLRPVSALGNYALLERVVVNLVDNAIKHNDPRGILDIVLGYEDGIIRFVVSNTGPVLDGDDCHRIFEPFVRLDEQRFGDSHGLGLSIVQSVIHAHGGSVTAHPRTGGGLTVTVELAKPNHAPA